MGWHIQAFPVWRLRREEGIVEATQHPDTGKWWFRRTHLERVYVQGEWRDLWKMGKWECPENQPAEPVLGMKLLRRRTLQGKIDYKRAMLPRDLSTPLPPKRPRGRPRKERHDDQERHPQS